MFSIFLDIRVIISSTDESLGGIEGIIRVSDSLEEFLEKRCEDDVLVFWQEHQQVFDHH